MKKPITKPHLYICRTRGGEKGIMIFAPMLGRTRKESQQTDSKDAESTVSLVGFRFTGEMTMWGSSSIPPFTEDGRTLLNGKLKREHIAFARTWDANLRSQGFLEAFVGQQKGDT